MQIETLQIFCDLAELKSFSRTAEKNMVSQSAVSQQITQLERIFNTPLINRQRKSFGLTDAGEMFYNMSKDIITRYDNFLSNLNYLKNSAKGKIAAAAIYSIGMHTLQEYVKKFVAAHPHVQLDLEYLSSAEIYTRLLIGQIDVGLVAVPHSSPDIQVFDFIAEPMVCVCSPQHPFAKKTSLDICMVQYEPFIAFARNVPTRDFIDQMLIRYNIAVKPVMEFDNVETIKRVVEINAGISIMPETTLKNEIANGTLKAIPFSNENFKRPTGIVIRKNRVMNENIKAFIELLYGKKIHKN